MLYYTTNKKIMEWVVLIMAKGLSYQELFQEAPDSFVVAEIVGRNNKNRFAEAFQIVHKCITKSDADKWLGFLQSEGVDACIIPTFEESDLGVQITVVGGKVGNVGQLFSPADNARFFRAYYGL